MSKVKYLLIVILFTLNASLHAQKTTKLSMEFTGGIPIPLTFFSPSVSTYGGIGIKYNLLKEIAVGGQISIGSLRGKNKSPNDALVVPEDNDNYSSFSNNFIRYTLDGQVNLERVFNLRRAMHRINPYLTFGGGLISSSSSADKVNGTERSYSKNNYYTYYSGLMMKYYLNPSLDFMLGATYNVSETYYADAVPIDQKLDNYVMTYVGISFKVGARKDKQHAEWENVILKDRIYIPDIEKRQGQPVDAAGNFFIFHKDSIAKLQSQTLALEGKTAKLEEENTQQQKQIDSIQVQTQVMKTRMDTLESQMNQLREQINKQQEPKKDNTTPTPSKGNGGAVVGAAVVTGKGRSTGKQGTDKQQTGPKENKSGQSGKAGQDHKIAKREQTDIPSSGNLNSIDGVTPPVARYNIIVGAYRGPKYAMIFRNKLRAQGYDAAVFKSNINSHILRVCIFSTDDKAKALEVLRKVRKDINSEAWMHIYNSK